MATGGFLPQPLWWHRCTLRSWLRLLARQSFGFDRALWPRVLRTTVSCAGVSVLGLLQECLYGFAVRRTEITEAPLFLLGHWRSGTTYLHDLLCCDERHNFPTRYDCAAPNHFLLTGKVARRFWGKAAPAKRLMDNVKVDLDSPAEDEVGFSVLGIPSPYTDGAFPNRPRLYDDFLDLEKVAPAAREAWKRAVRRFWQSLAYARPGRLLLKSPTHTARIKILLEMFPEARFVHIVRNPYDVFPSMRKTVNAMWTQIGLQAPPFPRLDDYIFDNYVRVMDLVDADRTLIDPARYHELRYEDLASDPIGQVRTIYERLALSGVDRMLPRLEQYVARLADYQKNQHELTADVRNAITQRWGRFITRYGYALQ